MNSSQPLNISPALILQVCLPESHLYDKASLGCASPARGTHWHTPGPAQEGKGTVLLPSACSRLSCSGDVQCHLCVLTGTPSVLSTVQSLASLIYVNIKYCCCSEVLFWLDLCDLKDLRLQTSSGRKTYGITQKVELNSSCLTWTTEKSQASSHRVHGERQPSPSPYWKGCLKQAGGIASPGKIQLPTLDRSIWCRLKCSKESCSASRCHSRWQGSPTCPVSHLRATCRSLETQESQLELPTQRCGWPKQMLISCKHKDAKNQFNQDRWLKFSEIISAHGFSDAPNHLLHVSKPELSEVSPEPSPGAGQHIITGAAPCTKHCRDL